ncbi:hypothetical protein IHV12_15255 [Fictibacillus sp. 7GRE50]|uniref:hypothetical protein n=1 Tax=Fictibacillus sp. 7GRE50 TaxID=2745878 RepID=UPI0018CD543D|nr:hypothetical protein [Fictibacillus sp. 7GRE50]MBH0166279.1 hypothetical protein [Fictibacillus sp. 7GRE50]
MARFSDLVNVNINRDTIKVQGVEIPVIFTIKSFAYVEEAYGEPYHVFEKDLYAMLEKGKVKLGVEEIRAINTLVYAMIRSGGTEATFEEIETAIPPSDLPQVFKVVIGIFNNQNFQRSDMAKIKNTKKKS